MSMAITILVFLYLLLSPQSKPLQRFEFLHPVMGTQARVVLYSADEAYAKKAADAAFARMESLNRILSDYLEDSELNQLCRQAGGAAVPVSAELFAVLAYGQEIAERSKGAFDVTIGPLSQLWRRSRRQQHLPDPTVLAKAKTLVGYQHLRLEPKQRTAQLLRAGMRLDLGGIAKGYAADEALQVLKKLGIRHALVAIGGDIVVSDAPPGAPGWVIGVAPLEARKPEATPALLLANAAVSTSGDAEQFVEIGGERYSHIVDPKTGLGLRQRSRVTVVAPHGMMADALATAVTVLGPEQGIALVETIPKAAAHVRLVSTAGRIDEKSSQTWAGLPRKSD